MLALYTGMRSNEIAETEIIDVYDDHIFIPESKTESSVSGNCQCSCRLGG
jgi:hypothetical protein